MDHTLSRPGRKAPRPAHGRRFGRFAPVLHILCAWALLLVGSIHQPPQARGVSGGFDAAAYVLPDGTVPELCLSGDGEEDRGAAIPHRHGCEACRLTALPDLPPPAGGLFQPADYRRLTLAAPDDPARAAGAPRYRAPARGPPVSDLSA